jgi:hypothetical protein
MDVGQKARHKPCPDTASVDSQNRMAPSMAHAGREPEGYPGYDVVKAASDYSNVTGLVSGFALTAVVLAFTVAATADLRPEQRIDLGFATTLFALGFVGCLLCAFSFASLAGERRSVATLTHSMLGGSGLSVCIVAVLGGFEALAQAFLPDSSVVFLIVCAAVAAAAPPFVWFPQVDIVRAYGAPSYPGPPDSLDEARRLIRNLSLLGFASAAGGVVVQSVGLLGATRHWEHLVITFVGLGYSVAMVLAALWASTLTERARVSIKRTWGLAFFQSGTIFVMIALLP